MSNLKINNLIAVQENFLGNGAVYHGYAGMPDVDGRVYSDKLCQIEAERAAKMKLKIARTMYRWWGWDKDTNTWNWDNEIMTAFYKWLKRMKDANITVALNTGWTNPGDINSTSWMNKSPFTVEGDWDKSVQNYADSFVNGDHRMGVMPILTRNFVPHLSYYAFGLISRFVESGSTIYEGFGENFIHTTMAVAPNGDVTVIVVNCKIQNDNFKIDFEKPLNLALNRHAFDPNTLIPDEKADMIKSDKTVYAEKSLEDSIAPFGINVYTTIKD